LMRHQSASQPEQEYQWSKMLGRRGTGEVEV
jgi:hypothetical protein